MDMVEIAYEELQFDYDLINLFFAEPAMEDGYIPNSGGSGTANINTNDTVADSGIKTKGNYNPRGKVIAYNVNENRSNDTKRDFAARIDSFVKMIFELIERALARIRVKFAKMQSSQKSFVVEIKKIQKTRSINYDLKCKNYIYDDGVIIKLDRVLATEYNTIKPSINEWINTFRNIIHKPDGPGVDKAAEEYIQKHEKDGEGEVYTNIAKNIGFKGELGGEGDFFNGVRRMYRGTEDVVEFALRARREELSKAENFMENYSDYVDAYVGQLDKVRDSFTSFKREITNIKNASVEKTDALKKIDKNLAFLSKKVSFIINCYTFIVSLLQERLYNCRSLVRRAYGLS